MPGRSHEGVTTDDIGRALDAGVDAVHVGAVELSLMLGLPPGSVHEHAWFTTAVDCTLAGCAQHGVVAGIHADASLSGTWAKMGFRMITVVFDQQSVVGGLRSMLDESRLGCATMTT